MDALELLVARLHIMSTFVDAFSGAMHANTFKEPCTGQPSIFRSIWPCICSMHQSEHHIVSMTARLESSRVYWIWSPQPTTSRVHHWCNQIQQNGKTIKYMVNTQHIYRSISHDTNDTWKESQRVTLARSSYLQGLAQPLAGLALPLGPVYSQKWPKRRSLMDEFVVANHCRCRGDRHES